MRKLNRPSNAQSVGKGLGQYTGASSQDEQNAEGRRILEMLEDGVNIWAMTEWERVFVDDLLSNPDRVITGRMLFKLRDIKDRYL